MFGLCRLFTRSLLFHLSTFPLGFQDRKRLGCRARNLPIRSPLPPSSGRHAAAGWRTFTSQVRDTGDPDESAGMGSLRVVTCWSAFHFLSSHVGLWSAYELLPMSRLALDVAMNPRGQRTAWPCLFPHRWSESVQPGTLPWGAFSGLSFSLCIHASGVQPFVARGPHSTWYQLSRATTWRLCPREKWNFTAIYRSVRFEPEAPSLAGWGLIYRYNSLYNYRFYNYWITYIKMN